MKPPNPTDCVALCVGCADRELQSSAWQLQVDQRALSEHGGAIETFRAVAEAVDAHWRADHPDADVRGLLLGDGTPATGGVAMVPLPRWWVRR